MGAAPPDAARGRAPGRAGVAAGAGRSSGSITAHRGQGLAAFLLDAALSDLRTRGVRRVEAFPKRGTDFDVDDLWNGPEAMFRVAGFAVVRDDPRRPVLAIVLNE